jgi:hypothetical protein
MEHPREHPMETIKVHKLQVRTTRRHSNIERRRGPLEPGVEGFKADEELVGYVEP